MNPEYFVEEHSVVREIWGNSDTILFIFAGASAEFALNKAVDWLYFTGRLPSDPIGRLFSTVSYARTIVFAEKQTALQAIDSMAAIHANLEARRGYAIPDWAYRDVLFMLIDYSIRSFEIMERKLSTEEKHEVFRVFNRVGNRMRLAGLPTTLEGWEIMRQQHLEDDLQKSQYTSNLYDQYKKHLGALRFRLLREVQTLVVPARVRHLLGLNGTILLPPILALYKLCRRLRIDWLIKSLVLPGRYKNQILALDL